MSDNTDVAVVGGGVAGLGIAWRAAARGARVCVVDDRPGAGASHVAAGLIAPVTEVAYGEEGVLALNIASARRWPAFVEELETASGLAVPYLDHGTLAVAFDHDDLRALLDLREFQAALGLECGRLRSRECRQLEPGLAPAVRGGLFVPGEGQVDNRVVVAALLRACERSGVTFARRRAARLLVERDTAMGVELDDGTPIGARTVVLAAGSWSSGLDGLPREATPPVRPVKGQILRLRGSVDAPVVRHNVRALVEGSPVYVVSRADGEVVVGGTVEERGFDTTVTAEAVHDLLHDAVRVVPAIADLEFVEASAGLRPGTPDNAPVLGVTSVEGLVLATGHYRHGFLLLPVTADGIAQLVVDGHLPDELAPFSPDRFAVEEARV